MHEFSICRGLINQLERIAAGHGAHRVRSATLCVGPLCGVDAGLLRRAFAALSASGSGTGPTAGAELYIDCPTPQVLCRDCGAESATSCQQLSCKHCGSPRTKLLSGDELLLLNLELETEPEPADV